MLEVTFLYATHSMLGSQPAKPLFSIRVSDLSSYFRILFHAFGFACSAIFGRLMHGLHPSMEMLFAE